jgi:hypothetical protein
MRESRQIIHFRGAVTCHRDDETPLRLTLTGRTESNPEEIATLAFATDAAAELPEVLEDPAVEQVATNRYRVAAGGREWLFAATALHMHHEVSKPFYEAVAPRRAPWRKRMFWRVVLTVMRSATGRRLMLALRRR